jgi:hypothetical protein
MTWISGQPQTYSITVTNTGTQTWNATGPNPVHLGIYFNGSSDAIGAWASEPQRAALTTDLAPGQSETILVTVTPPSKPGTYVLRQRMVKENVAWFDQVQDTTVTVI